MGNVVDLIEKYLSSNDGGDEISNGVISEGFF